MARTLFFRMVFRKFSEITNNKPIFSQYNIFYNYEYFFFRSAFWSLFNHCQRSQSNQEQCSLFCNLPCFLVLLCTHYGPLQCFSTYFRKLKDIGVLRPIFSDLFLVALLWMIILLQGNIDARTLGIRSLKRVYRKIKNNDKPDNNIIKD